MAREQEGIYIYIYIYICIYIYVYISLVPPRLRPLLLRLLSLPGGATTPRTWKIILLGYIAVCVNDARTLRSRVVRESSAVCYG